MSVRRNLRVVDDSFTDAECVRPAWTKRLHWKSPDKLREDGTYACRNAVLIFDESPYWQGRIRFDVTTGKLTLWAPPWSMEAEPQRLPITVDDLHMMQTWLETKYDFHVSTDDLAIAASVVGHTNPGKSKS